MIATYNGDLVSARVPIINVRWIKPTAGAGLAAPFCGNMAIGSTTLTLVSNIQSGNGAARFSPAHVGYTVRVPFAAAGATDLYTTITAYVSPTQVTLAAPNASGALVNNVDTFWWPPGQDDTSAILTAIAEASSVSGRIYLPDGVYPTSAAITNALQFKGMLGNGFNACFIVSNSASNTNPILSFTDTPWGFTLHGIACAGRGQDASGTENIIEFLCGTSKSSNIADIRNIRTLLGPQNGLYMQSMIASFISNAIFDDVGNIGFFADVNPFNSGGGTSLTLAGLYSFDNPIAYKINNYAYSNFTGLAADSNNVNYWLVNSENIVLSGCGCEVPIKDQAAGYIIDGGANNSLLQCYWTQVNNADNVGIVIKNNADRTIIDGFFSNQPHITPAVDISIASGCTNTAIRNVKSTATTPISDSGTNTLIVDGNDFKSAVQFENIAKAIYSAAPLPTSDLGIDLGSTAKRWANLNVGNARISTDMLIRAGGTLRWSSTSDPTGTADTGISRDSAGTLFFGNGTQDDKSGVICALLSQMRRFAARWGTNVVAGDFALGAGWGTGATVTVGANSKDQGGLILITAGTSPSANPAVTFTFHDGSFGTVPAVVCARVRGAPPTTGFWEIEDSGLSSTQVQFDFIGLPVTGNVYGLAWVVMGT